MRRSALLLLLASCAAPEIRIDASQLEATIRFLAGDEMKGRAPGTPEHDRAAQWILSKFREYGLRASTQEFDFPIAAGRTVRGINVMGVLPGASDEIVVIGAHHDHLGVRNGMIYNGADDNASGVAVLLEAARTAPRSGRRTLVFVSFDLEESGLVGSTRWVASGTVDMDRVVAMICMDLVGGHFFKTEERTLFALGSEYSPEVAAAVRRCPRPEGLDVAPMGIFVMEPFGPTFARSDYLAFRNRKVPFVFLSTGTPWYYHTPQDDVDRIDFPKLSRVAEFVLGLTKDLASGDRPQFRPDPPPTLDDARGIGSRIAAILSGEAGLTVDDPARKSLAGQLQKIQEAVRAGKIDAAAKSAMQGAMVTVFQLVSRSRPK